MIKDIITLWQKYFGTSKPAPTKTRKPTHVSQETRRARLHSLVSEIGKEVFNENVKMEWGLCPHCNFNTHMISSTIEYWRCTNCHELVRQYVNGSIQYLPLTEKRLGYVPKEEK